MAAGNVDVSAGKVDVSAGKVDVTAGNVDVSAGVPREDENTTVDLARIGWLATVVACLIAVVILSVQGYYGYALVTLAVAISAGINLF